MRDSTKRGKSRCAHTIGSTLGGLVPALWHAGLLSLWGIVLSTIGGVLGIWAGYRMSRMG